MYPQPEPREMENGVIPSSGKIQKITPEWQTEQPRPVDSAVARVKGKHHDGDVISWAAFYAVKSGGTASAFVLCGGRCFFNGKAEKAQRISGASNFPDINIKAEKPHHHIYERKSGLAAGKHRIFEKHLLHS